MDNSSPSVYQVVIPRLGLTMVEANILEWYCKEGDWVNKGEPLFAIENEKASVDIESPASGYLHILAPLGVTLPVLTPIAEIHSEPIQHSLDLATSPVADKEKSSYAQSTKIESTESPSADEMPFSRPAASPKARQFAQDLGLNLEQISGSGMRGMITSADVQRHAAGLQRRASPLAERIAAEAGLDLSQVQGSGSHGRIVRRDVEAALQNARPSTPASRTVQPLSGLRAVIAERLSASWQERPQVTLFTEADAVELKQARLQLNQFLAKQGEKVSLNTILVKICAFALQEHPALNSYLQDGQIIQPEEINIGVAVETERGLVVPVVHQANRKSLRQIQREMSELIQRALQNRCTVQDLQGGTFSITNLGLYEIDGFTPLINPPQTAILGIGRIRPKPAEQNGQLVLRDQFTLSLSFDHRLVDGAPAARFLQRIKCLIEHPFLLVW